jgi:hypothetical protein
VAHPGDEFIRRVAGVSEAERLADDLARRGGGLTAHAVDLLRDRAGREREQLARDVDRVIDGDETL